LRGLATRAARCASPAGFRSHRPAKKPNILVIWGDDIGGFNVSAYNLGMMGYKTPNIDRIAREGVLFTDQWFAERMFAFAPTGAFVGQWLQSFREFPPRQKPGSFNLDHVMEAVSKPHAGGN